MPTTSPPVPVPGPPAPVQIIDQTTVFSLLGTVAVLAAAYGLSLRALPRYTTTTTSRATKARILFIWHTFDALIHFIFEGSFLWNCFFVHAPSYDPSSSSSVSSPSEFLPTNVYFLNLPDRVFGATYGSGPFSKLWREYAKADKRWGGTDLTVVSLEILTVFVGGPLALWCAEMVRRGEWNIHGRKTKRKGGVGSDVDVDVDVGVGVDNRKWFWMIVLATGELYGGWMTFVPEWLSGSPNLVTSNFMYKWVYLFFFNTLWVFIPLWILVEAYKGITGTTAKGGRVDNSKEL